MIYHLDNKQIHLNERWCITLNTINIMYECWNKGYDFLLGHACGVYILLKCCAYFFYRVMLGASALLLVLTQHFLLIPKLPYGWSIWFVRMNLICKYNLNIRINLIRITHTDHVDPYDSFLRIHLKCWVHIASPFFVP